MLRTPSERTGGWTSRCRDGRHVIFLDYDGLTQLEVVNELMYLQKKYELEDFFIFKNAKESYHAICPDKHNLNEATDIIYDTSADPSFKRAPYSYGKKRWVLRMESKGERDKPQYICTLAGTPNKKEKSNAHLCVLETYYDIKIPNYKYKDEHTILDYCKYTTGSKIYKKDLK